MSNQRTAASVPEFMKDIHNPPGSLIGVYNLLKLKFDDVLGIACGSIDNPAILVCANQLVPTGKPNIIYATIFLGVGTIVNLVAVQVFNAT